MAYYDNEVNIINEFNDIDYNDMMFLDEKGKDIVKKIRNFEDWITSNGKSDPPPDIYSNKYNLMMDIMRVDDHTSTNEKGKLYNPYRIKEQEKYKEIQRWLKENNIIVKGDIVVNTVTDLPTEEDHSYDKYLSEFSRVVKKHDESYNLYIRNHPNKKMIYFILDESSPYICTKDKNIVIKKGNRVCAKLHEFFYDENFVKVLRESKADYVIWYAPFKYFDSDEKITLPVVIIYTKEDLNEIKIIKYDQSRMLSLEE